VQGHLLSFAKTKHLSMVMQLIWTASHGSLDGYTILVDVHSGTKDNREVANQSGMSEAPSGAGAAVTSLLKNVAWLYGLFV
jgi:hypothetical protein